MSDAESDQTGATRLPQAAAEIRQGVTRLSRRLRSERPPGGFSSSKLSVLSYLLRNGPAAASEVAAADHQQPQSLTRVFASLEREHLIARTRDDRDRRQSLLSITEAGHQSLRRDMIQRDDWLASALTGLTETECELLRLAARLMDRIADATPGDSELTGSDGARVA
ncbi:MAG: MarR family winged helix-turn-helix transcriptional regulator [Streptosporangiaceae bacterium]|jgi:DNA-binding MarR family transcriptional regulator